MFIGNSHNYTLFGTKVIAGNVHCSKYEPNHQWFSCAKYKPNHQWGVYYLFYGPRLDENLHCLKYVPNHQSWVVFFFRWKCSLSQIWAKSPMRGVFISGSRSSKNFHCPKYEPNYQWEVFFPLIPLWLFDPYLRQWDLDFF